MAEGGGHVAVAAHSPSSSASISTTHTHRLNQENSRDNTQTRIAQSIERRAHHKQANVIVPENIINEMTANQNEANEKSIGVSLPTRTPMKIERDKNKVGKQSNGGIMSAPTQIERETTQNLVSEQSVHNNLPVRAPINTEIEAVQNEVDSPQGDVLVTSSSHLHAALEPSGAIIKKEMMKSILYGGLTELIASLGIVTSAASTKATTGKIVALSLAGLITGVFIMTYKISDLWMNKQQEGSDAQNDENVDQYEELFGDRKNYLLHFTVAIISFIIFGLVPPLVYGFTFCQPEDKNLKIPTVTIATVLCTALLGAIKAHLEGQNNCVGYINTIGKCIVDAIGTSFLTTIGGDIIEKYIEQIGWFEPNEKPTLFLQSMSFENRTWGAF